MGRMHEASAEPASSSLSYFHAPELFHGIFSSQISLAVGFPSSSEILGIGSSEKVEKPTAMSGEQQQEQSGERYVLVDFHAVFLPSFSPSPAVFHYRKSFF